MMPDTIDLECTRYGIPRFFTVNCKLDNESSDNNLTEAELEEYDAGRIITLL